MNFKYLLIIPLLSVVTFSQLYAQTDNTHNGSTTYQLEAVGTIACEDQTPFWIVSNRYGVVPLEAANGLIRAGVFHSQQSDNGFKWAAGIDLVGAEPRDCNIFIQQIYAEVGYKSILLSIGSKERYFSFLDKRLSSGDMVLSPNARPIPEINLSIPHFTVVPYTNGWLQVKGDIAVGRSFDRDYLHDYTSVAIKTPVYINDILWHHKSGFLRIEDTNNDSPLFGIVGLTHWAQWGGTSTNSNLGTQPQCFNDLFRIIVGSEGNKEASISDQINVLGNHFGSYYFSLGYNTTGTGKIQAYYQHYFDDKSGMEFANRFDGLWGIEVETNRLSWLNKIVFEFLTTKNQSGPMHFINFDHDKYSGRGGGADNYYNNGEYTTGASYFNRALGSPIIISPEYNGNGELGFKNNRVQSWHLGAEGNLSPQVSYRLFLTRMTGWGRAGKPFLNTKSSFATLAEVTYTHPSLSGWEFTGSAAVDTGDMIGKNSGFSLSIRKKGVLKNW